MSSPEATAVLPDQAPAVPPPSSRKPTASEKADEALAMIADLERKIESAFDTHPDLASNVHAAAPLTSEQAAALEKVPALDGDLDALGQALNELSTRVDNLPATASADGDKARFDEMARAFAQLQENVRATLSEVRAVVDPNVEVTEALEHVRQEQGSYGRAVDALTERLVQVENRSVSATPSPRPAGAPASPLVLGAVLRLMRRVPELGKSKQAPSSAGGFKFRGIEAVMDAIGSAMREDDIGLIMRTEVVSRDITRETIKDRTWTSTDLVIRYVFVHPEDGSEHAFEMAGEGRDLGDKASSKAASMAAKYALCQALMIPFNGMADSDADDPATQQAQQHAPADARDQEARELARQDYERDRARESEQGQQQVAREAQQQPPADEPEDQRSPEEKATAVVAALERLNTFSLEDARARFDRIASAATTQGLTGLIVDGSNIALHLQVHRTLLDRAAAAAPRG